ncbi:MAG: cytochrome b559 subunit alpha [Cyanobacteria bacterium P01_F01_bin.33]
MAGSTGERPFGEIVTDVQFWKLHVVNIPAIFISGFLFVTTGLAYDAFGTPRPNEYFPYYQQELPVVNQRLEVRSQLDEYFEKGENPSAAAAPRLFEEEGN